MLKKTKTYIIITFGVFSLRLQHHHFSLQRVSRETAGGFGAVRASLVMEVSVQTTHSLQTAFYNMDLPARVSAFNSMSMALDSWDMAFQGYEIAGIDQICKLFATKINSTWGGGNTPFTDGSCKYVSTPSLEVGNISLNIYGLRPVTSLFGHDMYLGPA